MRVKGSDYRTVWMEEATVCLIEQNLLPFEFRIYRAEHYRDTCMAISTMIVRGAGAIGGTIGAYWARRGVPVRMVDLVEDLHEGILANLLGILRVLQIVQTKVVDHFDVVLVDLPEQLLTHADQALYASKRQGKNAVSVFTLPAIAPAISRPALKLA